MKELLDQAEEIQGNLEKCSACGKKLPPGTPVNKGWDEKLGSWTICVDCSMKAIVFYLRKLHGFEMQ